MANTCKSYARKQKWVFFSEYSVDHIRAQLDPQSAI